jgi:O-antigen/teichoic acid export membrane protein
MEDDDGQATLWRAGAHTFGTSIASILLGLAGSVIIGRALGPEGKGAYDLMIATGGLLVIGVGLSIPSGVTFVVARDLAAPGHLLRSLSLINVGLAALAAILLLMSRIGGIGAAFIPADIGVAAIIPISLYVWFTLTISSVRAIMVARGRFVSANWRDLLSRFVTVVLAAAGVGAIAKVQVASADAPLVLVWLAVLASAISLGLFTRASLPDLKTTGATGLGNVLRFAAPSYLANIAQFLNYRLDLFLVALWLGSAQVGLYALAVMLSQLIWVVANAAAGVVMPRIAAHPTRLAANIEETALFTRVAASASVLAAIALGASASFMIPFVYGSPFRDSVAPLIWLLPGVLALAPARVLAAYVAGIGRPRLNLLVSVIGLVATLALDLVLIPTLGIVGAAIASTVSYTLTAAAVFLIFQRLTGVDPLRLIILSRSDIRIIVGATRIRKSRGASR